MSSLRRILTAQTNGRRSQGPKTPEGRQRAAGNALRHGLLAKCTVLENESSSGFDVVLADHIERLGPLDGVELGLVEDMVAAFWRTRRGMAIETQLMNSALERQPEGPELPRLAAAFTELAAGPTLPLLHRYQTRLHNIYQRALYNLLLLRAVLPNEPNSPPDPPEPLPLAPPPDQTP